MNYLRAICLISLFFLLQGCYDVGYVLGSATRSAADIAVMRV